MRSIARLLAILYVYASSVALANTLEYSTLSPSLEELTQFSELASYDLLHSEFVTKGGDKKILAISDFYNLADFTLDSTLLARVFLQHIKDSKVFTLTNAIAGNASNTDPMLDTIRARRNTLEFGDVIPKGALLAPKYSLSGRISSDVKELGSKTIIQYNIILSITNLESGILEWDYVDSIKKTYEGKIPESFFTQTRYGLICSGSLNADMPQKEACELAIAEIWEGSFQNIAANKQSYIVKYAKKACDLDSAFGCRALGASYRYGVGEKQDFTKALQFYNKSCSNADGNGCYNVALMYQNGQGAAQNLDEAQTYAYRSCTLDFEAGCVLHEKILALMQKDTLTKQAEELLQQCEQNDSIACGNIAFYYDHGLQGATRNPTKAVYFFQKGCELGDVNSCYQIGLWHVSGLGGTLKDWSIAAQYIEKSCHIYTREQACANTTHQKQCQGNFEIYKSNACFSLGSLYEHGGINLKQDTKKALECYQESCDMGLENACVYFSNLKESLK